ncbi:diacylglycerol/lipid kinase family protein [Naumannella halotolerans]|uniref:diacylglycerol/lipid kinase family protein n=1 Tax=Naumannella halotolerans TaxID=993414 RepID=UPI00370DB7C1
MSRHRISLLANPSAGRGRAASKISQVRDAMAAAVPDASVHLLDADDFAQARTAGAEVIAGAQPGEELVVMGGDGMLGMGIDLAADSGVPVGLIPAGTGNDICRGLGVPLKTADAVATIAHGPVRAVDLIEVTGALADGQHRRHVGSIVATGFDARVNRWANRSNLPIGALRYTAALIGEIATFHPINYRLTIDGRVRELPAILVAVANTPFFGGGIAIAPGADPRDGLLDVTVIHPVGRLDLIRLMPKLPSGRFTHHPAVERFRVESLEVDGEEVFAMGDGEELGPGPVRLRAAPGALRVHLPA